MLISVAALLKNANLARADLKGANMSETISQKQIYLKLNLVG
ncbi:MAG: hypothetical protein F6K22_20840 [Okeania sp. SIO2F4]|nr:hypothetical protein [Okeania sp. SIO2F4]